MGKKVSIVSRRLWRAEESIESQGKVVGKQRGDAGLMGRRAIVAYFTYSEELGMSFFHNPFETLLEQREHVERILVQLPFGGAG